ncbi:MAG: phage tail protein [Acidobacteriota bacterium]
MSTIDLLKEQEATATPVFLLDCVLRDGTVERWATHQVTFGGVDYAARLLRHDLFELRSSAGDGFDGAAKIRVTLANADSHFSQLERETGFKGARVTVRFLFFDLYGGSAASEDRVVFQGVGGAADEISEAELSVTFANRFNLQRIILPEVRIQRRCPWLFPATEEQRQEALDGGTKGPYSALFRCGYSAGLAGGTGTLNGSEPFVSCNYTRVSCEQRGMFSEGRFGGLEFVPPQIQVRGYGEPGSHLSSIVDNQARYNDFVPLVYGTAWYEPPLVFSRNDGNLTHLEVLLGLGEIDDVIKVIVNDVEIPEAVEGRDMTATGWYHVVTKGARSGVQNPDFADAAGNPLGDPYGSMAMAAVVVPNRISANQSAPKIRVLIRGLKLEQFDGDGASQGFSFSRNPAWVLLDVLRRSGWLLSEVNVRSFATAAAYCDEAVETADLHGNSTYVSRYQCNLVVRQRRSAADLARGIRAGSALLLTHGAGGLLTLAVENTLARQQAAKPAGSNSASELNGGWPAYEFSDGSAEFSGILRRAGGEPSIRFHSRSAADSANRLTVEFQDEFNEYQQDSLSLVDVDDALLTGREVTAAFPALGLPNFDQATRVLDLQLAKLVDGNAFLELQTSVRGVGLAPGDIITVTYLKEGLLRQPFRINRVAPGTNYQSVQITAQWHDDAWYTQGGASAAGGRRRSDAEVGLPRPLVGSVLDEDGVAQFGVIEEVEPSGGGALVVKLRAAFVRPGSPAPSAAHIPLVSLTPVFAATGGTLGGGQTLYYAFSATDGEGSETGLSFTVRARIPSGTDTNAVTVQGLSFSSGTTGFHVYRGASPSQLLRIATDHAIADGFVDTGYTAELVGPPDENFDHANFYWRLELQPEVNVESYSPTTVGRSTLGMLANEFRGAIVRITRGTGAPQERSIVTNDATTLTISSPWKVEPDTTSFFTVAEATWNSAGSATSSPILFEVPGLPGATIQISGRATNVLNRESAFEMSPVTRWQIGADGGMDGGVAPAPTFGLDAVGKGMVELAGIGFTDLANTASITAGTMELFSWDELNGPTSFSLSSAVDDVSADIDLTPAGSAAIGQMLQLGQEVLEVLSVSGGGAHYHVLRGVNGSTAAAHGSGTPLFHLQRTTVIVPFVRGFFGSPASGSFAYSLYLPDVRIATATLYMTNSFGMGAIRSAAFGASVDEGIRTLSGGQVSIQVEGYLAIQDHAAPAMVMEDSHAARDIFAVVREAPDGGDIELSLLQDETIYCTLIVPDGETISDTVGGFGLPPLTANARLTLDITSVPGAANTLPGRDLTVTIRF